MAKTRSKNRYINTHFWDDTYIIDLDPIEKLLFLYSLTNPLTNISGIYEISLKRIAFDTGIDKDMVKKIFARFEDKKKMKYQDGWICITNSIKHQKLNPNITKGIISDMETSPLFMRNWLIECFKALESLSKPIQILLNALEGFNSDNANNNSGEMDNQEDSIKPLEAFQRLNKALDYCNCNGDCNCNGNGNEVDQTKDFDSCDSNLKIHIWNETLREHGLKSSIPANSPDHIGWFMELAEFTVEQHKKVYDFVLSKEGWNNPKMRTGITFKTIHKIDNFKNCLESAENLKQLAEKDGKSGSSAKFFENLATKPEPEGETAHA